MQSVKTTLLSKEAVSSALPAPISKKRGDGWSPNCKSLGKLNPKLVGQLKELTQALFAQPAAFVWPQF